MQRRTWVALGVVGLTVLFVGLAAMIPRSSGDLRQRATHHYPAPLWTGIGLRYYVWKDENTLILGSRIEISQPRSASGVTQRPVVRQEICQMDLGSGRIVPFPKPISIPIGFPSFARMSADGKALIWVEAERRTGYREVTTPLDGSPVTFAPVKNLSLYVIDRSARGEDICIDARAMKRNYPIHFWQAFLGQAYLSPIPPGKRILFLSVGPPGASNPRPITAAIPGRGQTVSFTPSSDGTRAAWLVAEQAPRWQQWIIRASRNLPPALRLPQGQPRFGLWVTDINGSNPQYLGYLQETAGNQSGSPILGATRWSPTGKQLAFSCDGKIWTVPVPSPTNER